MTVVAVAYRPPANLLAYIPKEGGARTHIQRISATTTTVFRRFEDTCLKSACLQSHTPALTTGIEPVYSPRQGDMFADTSREHPQQPPRVEDAAAFVVSQL